ncbi:MAG: hypothetical protein JRI68_35625, partial [Deltaproteobacteria bacterium]|nr:hypothetical protein [Deltaproteobacteria bacterium]
MGDGSELGPAADVFTVAAILWEMVGKRRLFAGSTAEVIGKNIAEHPIARVDSLKGPGIRAITEELANVVAQALSRSTDERFSSAEALASGVRGAGAKVGEHEEVARFIDELHGQTLLDRHRKIEQAVAPARPSGPGAGGKPSPFAATPSSKGKDDPEAEGEPEAKPGKDLASSRVLLGRKPAPPRPRASDPGTKGEKDDAPAAAAADQRSDEGGDDDVSRAKDETSPAKRPAPPKVPKRKKPAADQAKGAPPAPKRDEAPPKKEPPPPEDDVASSRKESAVVTMPAPRSQLARRRRPSQEKMKAALPGSKASKSVKPPPPDKDEAKAEKGKTAPAALEDEDKRGAERDVDLVAPTDSKPGDDGKPAPAAAKSGP